MKEDKHGHTFVRVRGSSSSSLYFWSYGVKGKDSASKPVFSPLSFPHHSRQMKNWGRLTETLAWTFLLSVFSGVLCSASPMSPGLRSNCALPSVKPLTLSAVWWRGFPDYNYILCYSFIPPEFKNDNCAIYCLLPQTLQKALTFKSEKCINTIVLRWMVG